jgi:hypothetical protein
MPQAGPANAVVEFENGSIVVVRIRMAPGEKTPMHDIASARLVVWLTDAHLRDIHPDGSTNETHRRAGEIDWVGVQRHAGENLAHSRWNFWRSCPRQVARPPRRNSSRAANRLSRVGFAVGGPLRRSVRR